jgi:hypothetical protein
MTFEMPTLSNLQSVIVLTIGSVTNFLAFCDPTKANVWVAFVCGILALVVTLPKAIDALLVLRKSIFQFKNALVEDINKLKGKK